MAIALRMAAQGLGKTMLPLSMFYRRIKSRIGGRGAITATAHKLARLVYRMRVRQGVRQAKHGAIRTKSETANGTVVASKGGGSGLQTDRRSATRSQAGPGSRSSVRDCQRPQPGGKLPTVAPRSTTPSDPMGGGKGEVLPKTAKHQQNIMY